MPVTLKEALAYLGIDETDATIKANVNNCIAAADAYLQSAVGEEYPRDDPKARQLALIIVSDFYNNREMLELAARQSQYGNVRRMVQDMVLQLRMELRRAAEL